jgi:hypothetical protein
MNNSIDDLTNTLNNININDTTLSSTTHTKLNIDEIKKLNKKDLIKMCKELDITGYTGKTNSFLIFLIESYNNNNNNNKIINKGTGAGGAKTTLNGRKFEDKTSIKTKLLENKFIKNNYYYEYNDKINNKKIIYLTQNGFKTYFKKNFNINNIYRKPDEAFIIIHNDEYHIKILEKKIKMLMVVLKIN